MPSLIERVAEMVESNTWPRIFPDAGMDVGTKVLVDFRDPRCYPGGAIPTAGIDAGATIINLAATDNSLSVVNAIASPAVGTAGLNIAVSAATTAISLPATTKLAALSNAKFGFGGWVKPRPYTHASANVCLAACADNTSTTNQWLIQRGSATPNVFSGRCSNVGANLTVENGELAHIFYVVEVVAGSVKVMGYKNGVLISTSVSFALPGGALPVPAAQPRIGVAGPYTNAAETALGRFNFVDFTVCEKTVEQYIADDYAQGLNGWLS